MNINIQSADLFYSIIIALIISYVIFFIIHAYKKQRDLTQSFWFKDLAKIVAGTFMFGAFIFQMLAILMSDSSSSGDFIIEHLVIYVFAGALFFFSINLFFGGLIDIFCRLFKNTLKK